MCIQNGYQYIYYPTLWRKTAFAVCRLYGVYRDRRGGCAGCILRYNCYLLPRLDLASPASSAGAGVSENRKCRDWQLLSPAAAGHHTGRVLSIVSRSSHHPDSDTDTDILWCIMKTLSQLYILFLSEIIKLWLKIEVKGRQKLVSYFYQCLVYLKIYICCFR